MAYTFEVFNGPYELFDVGSSEHDDGKEYPQPTIFTL